MLVSTANAQVAAVNQGNPSYIGSRLGSEPLKGSHLPFVHVTSWGSLDHR